MHIHTMVVHRDRHLDEDLAYLLVREFGQRTFGVDPASLKLKEISGVNHLRGDNPEVVELFSHLLPGLVRPTLIDADAMRFYGFLFVGTGGGMFDEHPKSGQSRTNNVSCVKLIADALGDDVPSALADLIEYADWEDARNTPRIPMPFELASLIRVLKNADAHYTDEILLLLGRVIEGRVRCAANISPRDLYDRALFEAQILKFLSHMFNDGEMPKATDPLTAMRELGVQDDPALQQLKEYLRDLPERAACENPDPDTNQGLLMYELATLATLLRGDNDDTSLFDDIPDIQWLLAEKYDEQSRFHEELRAQYEAVKDLRPVKLVNGKRLTVVFIESATFGLDRAARYFDKAGIIVIRNPDTGHVQILSAIKRLEKLRMGHTNVLLNQHSHLDEVAKVIRMAERQHAGRIIPFDPKEMVREGAVKGAECWWYDRRFPALFNGSRSAPDAPATLIPWDELKALVMLAVDDCIMAESCTSSGVCERRTCPMYGLYLKRCYDLREREGTAVGDGVFDIDALLADAIVPDEDDA